MTHPQIFSGLSSDTVVDIGNIDDSGSDHSGMSKGKRPDTEGSDANAKERNAAIDRDLFVRFIERRSTNERYWIRSVLILCIDDKFGVYPHRVEANRSSDGFKLTLSFEVAGPNTVDSGVRAFCLRRSFKNYVDGFFSVTAETYRPVACPVISENKLGVPELKGTRLGVGKRDCLETLKFEMFGTARDRTIDERYDSGEVTANCEIFVGGNFDVHCCSDLLSYRRMLKYLVKNGVM